MHRPHGYLHRKGHQECQEDIDLFLPGQRQAVQLQDFEIAHFVGHVDQGHQHEHRTEEGIQEKLERGIDAARSTPYPDDQEHRDQHRLPEHVEQGCIQCGKYPDHQAFHDQKRGHVLRGLILNHFPAGDHDDHRGEGRQNDQRHGDAVDTQMIVQLPVAQRHPVGILDELHDRRAGFELGKQRDRQGKGEDGHDQGQYPRLGGVAVTAGGEHGDPPEDRCPNH